MVNQAMPSRVVPTSDFVRPATVRVIVLDTQGLLPAESLPYGPRAWREVAAPALVERTGDRPPSGR